MKSVKLKSCFTFDFPQGHRLHSHSSLRNVSEIHGRCQEVMDSLPEQLRYYAQDKLPKPTTGSEKYSQARIMLDFLQNRFLLERVAMARGFPNAQSLLRTAMESLEITLMFWMMRDQLARYTAYFDWIVSFPSKYHTLELTDAPDHILWYTLRWSNLRRAS
jgi:hypothetical protein